MMRILPYLFLVLLISCNSKEQKVERNAADDAAVIEREIADYHQSLKRAFNGAAVSTDSLMDRFFDKNVYYVTYWGLSEPIDSTKKRMRSALPKMKEYESRLESVNIKVYGDGAFAFFILRQTYTLNGIQMDEYLPTTYVLERRGERWMVVHAHRTADFPTIQHLMDIARQREEAARKMNR
jgi:hypothetical protein